MTNDTLHLPIDEGTAFTDDTGQTWTVTGISREYTLDIGSVSDDGETESTRTVYYPEDTLVGKVDRGDLQLQVDDPEPEPEPERAFECEECGQTFETERGLLTHQGKVHTDDDDDGETDDE